MDELSEVSEVPVLSEIPVLSEARKKKIEERIQIALDGQPTPANRLGFLPPVDLYLLGEDYKNVVREHLPEDLRGDKTTGLSEALNGLLAKDYPREVRYAAYMLSRVWWALVWSVERQVFQTAERMWAVTARTVQSSEKADFIGEAKMAAYNAAIRWRPFRNGALVALWPTFVKAGVRLYLNTSGTYLTVHVCRVVRRAAEDYWHVRQWRQHQASLGISVTLEQAAEEMGYSFEATQKILDVHRSYQIVRDERTDDDQVSNPMGAIPSPDELPDDLVNRQHIYQVVNEGVALLPAREQTILEELLAGRSMREIAGEVGLSHERVRQIAQGALKRLHEYLLNAGIDEGSLEGLGGRQFQVGYLGG